MLKIDMTMIDSLRRLAALGRADKRMLARIAHAEAMAHLSADDLVWHGFLAAYRDFKSGSVRDPRSNGEERHLWVWLRDQRRHLASGDMTQHRQIEMESVPHHSWSARVSDFEVGLAGYLAFRVQHGRDPYRLGDHSGEARLANWLRERRREYNAGTLRADRSLAVESVPGHLWHPPRGPRGRR